MLNCNWPGNVRELENCVERTATMTRTNTIQDVDLPCQQNKCFSQVLQHYGQAQPVISDRARRVNENSPDIAPHDPVESFGEDDPNS